MYSTKGIETVFDLMAYTVKAMKESGYRICDIEDYVSDAIKDNSFNTVVVSKDRLEGCNEILNTNLKHSDEWFDNTWRDSYYASLWDDTDFDPYTDNPNKYKYIDNRRRYYWEDEDTDFKFSWEDNEDEREAYEGFSSCKNHYWDCTEEDSYDPWSTVDDKL